MGSINAKFDAVASRKYTTRDGQEKTQWINIGRAVEWDDGGIEIELTSVPVGGWWNGKIKLFAQKDKQPAAAPARQPVKAAPRDDFQDDAIPF